ncbi:AAA family ATPase [Candidatus Marithrix sp. Canyon 246]|uniref:AAA family ATPase n=1 Tax=Candidatus Marithrix sp. Canyon 246 TaxID=1827136 RepID=UPI00084A2955|nr:AAA family ATPase [Candidatus Marithrix sp. Canyon 246]
MLSKLEIENFKSIDSQVFTIKPLTILTGLNSTGKSSLIQAILLLSRFYSYSKQDIVSTLVAHFSDFSEIRNKYKNAKFLKISADHYSLLMDYDNVEHSTVLDGAALNYEDKLYYLSANRIGQEQLALLSKEQKIGRNGEYIFGYFEHNKDALLENSLVKFKTSGRTLKAQVNEWLQYIIELPISLQTEKITSTNVKVSFSSDGIDAINPFNLGAGNSYLVKVLIVTLMCRQKDLLLIENPEIHLHPKAQARLGEFFAWVAQAGVQIIVETHCEHLINKVKYQIYQEELSADDAIIYYKPSIQEDFIQLAVNQRGKFIDKEGNRVMFPSGFFDSTLQELLEIG